MTNKILWQPHNIQASLLYTFKSELEAETGLCFETYQDLWAWSVSDSVHNSGAFWNKVWDFCGVIGDKGEKFIEPHPDMRRTKFFPEARLNWAENLLKREGDSPAIISKVEKKEERVLSHKELNAQVSKLQQFLIENGIKEGDRVAGYLPNIPETLIAALAAASIGAVWCSASPDFGVQGVLDRFGQIEPKILITTDGYFYSGKTINNIPKIQEFLPQLPSVKKLIVIEMLENSDIQKNLPQAILWESIQKNYTAQKISFKRVAFNHPLFIMFSSGTTGIPKCIVHGHGGTLLQHLKEHQLQCDIKPNDRVFYFTTCGWMMWNWQISALASNATLVLYDGSPFFPKAEMLWDYAARHKVTLFGTGAKYIDALKAHEIKIDGKYDLTSLKTITSTGSPLVHESFDYVYENIKSDVHLASISGGTDILSCFVLGNPISPVLRGEIQGAGLGLDVAAMGDDGAPLDIGSGELVCRKAFPCMPIYFWNDASGEKYFNAYFNRFENIWCHGDWIEKTDANGFIIHGRSDATLNPGGVRIGTSEIYRQVEQIPEVLESIAVGQQFQGDERVILFVRLKDGFALNDDLIARIKTQIKTGASPRHVPAKILEVADIPRTKSNKIVELAVKEILHGRPVRNIESLANPEALEFYKNLKELSA